MQPPRTKNASSPVLNTNFAPVETVISLPFLISEARVKGFLFTVIVPYKSYITLIAANACMEIIVASGRTLVVI